jgi:uncharacterized protein (TIGR02117 family)
MRAIGKYLAVAVLVVAALAALGAVVPRPLIASDGPPQGEPMREVLVLANPIHTDIVFPADPDVLDRMSFIGDDGLPLDDPGLEWILLGWGSRTFYIETPTWGDLRPGPVARAFTLDHSALHVELAGEIDRDSDNVLSIMVGEDAFQAMLDEAIATFEREDGEPMLIPGAAYGEFDLFYEAEGAFNAFYGCNEWSARVLRAGGVRTGWWNPLPPSLMWSLRWANDTAPPTVQFSSDEALGRQP